MIKIQLEILWLKMQWIWLRTQNNIKDWQLAYQRLRYQWAIEENEELRAEAIRQGGARYIMEMDAVNHKGNQEPCQS